MWYPSGRKVTYDYDGAGCPSKAGLNTAGATDYVSAVTYHAHGAPYQTTLANGVVETAHYNNRLQADWLEAVKTSTSSSLWKQENFYCTGQTPCNNGNMISQRLTAPKTGGGTLELTTTYGEYDGVNRVTSAAESGEGTGWSQSYGYTADSTNGRFGNLSITGDGDASSLRCGSYNAANNRCNASGFGYDNAGNLTTYQGRTLTYDAENRQATLVDSGTTWTYSYDGEGRRVKKTDGGRTVVYVYDAMGRLAAEYDSAPPTGQPDCTTCFLTADHLGSTRLVTDSSGTVKRRYDYHPFGQEVNPGYGNRSTVTGYQANDPFSTRFTGKERDYESGLRLDYFGARYFSGAQGRFTTTDPLGIGAATPSDPQSWNMYAYGRNNPLLYVDPTGTSYQVCDSQGKCEEKSDEDFLKNYQKNNSYILANGTIYQRTEKGTQGASIGSYSFAGQELSQTGAAVVEDLGSRADASNQMIALVAGGSAAVGAGAALAPVVGQAANEVAFGEAAGRLFWSGALGEASATAAAASGGGRLISQSPLGSLWANVSAQWSSSVQYLGWQALSRFWSSGAGVTANVYATNPRAQSILMRIELPRLLQNPNVFKPLQYR